MSAAADPPGIRLTSRQDPHDSSWHSSRGFFCRPSAAAATLPLRKKKHPRKSVIKNSGIISKQLSKNANVTEQRPEAPARRTYTAEYDVDRERIPIRMKQETYDDIAKECEENYDADAVAGNVEDLTKTAVLLFLGYVDGATSLSASCGGGGGNPGSGWGRDPKEDEREWVRRCARMALQMNSKPTQRTRSFRR